MDKELNIYAMRVREWYGWHFPELGKIVTDNLLYARMVRLMGMSLLLYPPPSPLTIKYRSTRKRT
jgi:RNA processing factor Prp31